MTWIIIKRVILSFFGILELLILARAIMSFIALTVRSETFHRIYGTICAIVEPILSPIRKLLSKVSFLSALPVDFSPFVVLLLISFFSRAIQWL